MARKIVEIDCLGLKAGVMVRGRVTLGDAATLMLQFAPKRGCAMLVAHLAANMLETCGAKQGVAILLTIALAVVAKMPKVLAIMKQSELAAKMTAVKSTWIDSAAWGRLHLCSPMRRCSLALEHWEKIHGLFLR